MQRLPLTRLTRLFSVLCVCDELQVGQPPRRRCVLSICFFVDAPLSPLSLSLSYRRRRRLTFQERPVTHLAGFNTLSTPKLHYVITTVQSLRKCFADYCASIHLETLSKDWMQFFFFNSFILFNNIFIRRRTKYNWYSFIL